MPRKRRLFEGPLNARMTLDAIRGLKPVSELASFHRVPLSLIYGIHS